MDFQLPGRVDVAFDYGENGRPNRAGQFGLNALGDGTYQLLTRSAMTHNGLGQRVRLENSGPWSYQCYPEWGGLCFGLMSRTLLYDEGGHIIAEYRDNGIKFEYIYADDSPIAFIDYAGDEGGGAGTLYWIHTGHLMEPRFITDASGAVVGYPCGDYSPLRTEVCSAATSLALRFPGQYHLAETGYSYNYFRDYDPETGRYLQSDPIGLAGGLNTYAYAGNNPLRYIDPLGLTKEQIAQMLLLAKETQPDLAVPNEIGVAFFFPCEACGITNPITKNITIDDWALRNLSCAELRTLLELIIHESIHRTRARSDMLQRPFTHPDIYEEAKARTNRVIAEKCICEADS